MFYAQRCKTAVKESFADASKPRASAVASRRRKKGRKRERAARKNILPRVAPAAAAMFLMKFVAGKEIKNVMFRNNVSLEGYKNLIKNAALS